MNIMQGANVLASSNISRSFFSDSPDIPETTEGADMFKNGTCNSPANAFAMVVFPQPGGPYNNTPRGASTPVDKYISGCKIGNPINSINWVVMFSSPPKDDNFDVGGVWSILLFCLFKDCFDESFVRFFCFFSSACASSLVLSPVCGSLVASLDCVCHNDTTDLLNELESLTSIKFASSTLSKSLSAFTASANAFASFCLMISANSSASSFLTSCKTASMDFSNDARFIRLIWKSFSCTYSRTCPVFKSRAKAIYSNGSLSSSPHFFLLWAVSSSSNE
mmetsp:Transcript_5801/g.7004  ORF Transcript_5801/g.7004 Transcript_5801/m.7004 type:complete len:278 (-) Transcript_5801:273-1106(-)